MRRKLYLLAVVIMVPYFPIEMLFLYSNIMNGLHNLQPYNFAKTHNSPSFTRITYSSYAETDFVEMNHNYIAILTVIPIFWFFGVTKEAVNTYRVYGLALGLGKWFPKLHDEYDPDRTRTGPSTRSWSWGAQLGSFLRSKTTSSK
jgi:pheromone a factor receptor